MKSLAFTMELPDLASIATEFGELVSAYLGLGYPLGTAAVMAGDLQSARRVDDLMAAGESPRDCVWMVGSYARFDWAVKNLDRADLFSILPELWVASDPDDTKPEYLELWREAYARNKNRIITDGKRVPAGSIFTVYRGQLGDANGISWSLDRTIAQKFALSGGGRARVRGGIVRSRTVQRNEILAYLTARGEREVILKWLD